MSNFGGAETDGDVDIVAAGVHHTRVLRLPGHIHRLVDGQRVDVGAPGNHRARFATFEDGDHSVAGDPGSGFIAHLAQAARDLRTGRYLSIGELGMDVEPAPAFHQRLEELIRGGVDPVHGGAVEREPRARHEKNRQHTE